MQRDMTTALENDSCRMIHLSLDFHRNNKRTRSVLGRRKKYHTYDENNYCKHKPKVSSNDINTQRWTTTKI